ncbi:MAG: hypothetical protein KBI41_06455 [Kiritimatiellae bacterium]|jgi:uncharacterized membrane-anchored protein YitT (DUF2179 family)|nr:hypothetical protein [Kiritimatiellia bacterium]HHU14830.1 hypothetical protein [Lentisphaerota bacterium]HON47795.1 hypothetical protein [Kiritimatiellia bacterium]
MSTNDPTSTSVFTSATVRASLPLALRFAVYTLLVAALSVMLPDIVRHHGVEFFYENGSLEWFQFGLLTTNILLFTLSALCLPKHRQLALLLGCVTAFAATREVDRVLNRLLPVVGWKIGGVFLVVAAWLLVRHHRTLLPQIAAFLRTPAFAVLWAGFMVAVPLAQLVGHGPFFRLFMDEEHVRNIKRVFEESGEFCGYLILLFGTIESILHFATAQEEVH